LEVTLPVEITGNLVDYENSIKNTNAFSNLSLEANSDLRQLNIQQQQLQKLLSIQRTQRMPVLAAFGNYTYAGTGNKAGKSPFTGQFSPANESWYSQGLIVGLQMNIPLTGIFTNTAKEQQTKVQIKQLDIQRGYLEESLNLLVRTSINNMGKALKQAESAKSNEELAKKGYDISLKRYDNGMGTILELQSASLSLTQAQLARSQAIVSYLNSKADLDKTLGVEN